MVHMCSYRIGRRRRGTVRIWDLATRQPQTLMRVDGEIRAKAWAGSGALAVGASACLYLFAFRTDISSGTDRDSPSIRPR